MTDLSSEYLVGKGIVATPCFSQWPPKPEAPVAWSIDPDEWGI